jgi:hypothetical protein
VEGGAIGTPTLPRPSGAFGETKQGLHAWKGTKTGEKFCAGKSKIRVADISVDKKTSSCLIETKKSAALFVAGNGSLSDRRI